jgi:hypothetical protein
VTHHLFGSEVLRRSTPSTPSIASLALGAAAAALVGLGAACTPADLGEAADAGTFTPTDGGKTVAQACSDYAYAYCSHLQMCSPTAVELRYIDIATCVSAYDALCTAGQSAPDTGATPASSEACVAALPNWPCADFLNTQNIPPDCQVAKGARANGAPCAVRQQCQTGYCGIVPGSACGTCAPVPQVGDSCTAQQCPPGLTCAGAGQTCVGFAQVGASCGAIQPCAAGLTCVGATATASGICQAGVQTQGSACVFQGAGCDVFSALACNAQSGTCATAQLSAPGQACGQVDNQLAYCIAGTCVRGQCVGFAPVGGACDADGSASCLDTLRCVQSADASAGVCEVVGATACP